MSTKPGIDGERRVPLSPVSRRAFLLRAPATVAAVGVVAACGSGGGYYDYGDACYCNACGQNYTTACGSYCNYFDYCDGCLC